MKHKTNRFFFPIFIISLVFILFSFLSAQGRNYQYELDISDAYNQISKNNLLEAGKIVNGYLGKNLPDAEYIMGKIFFQRSFYQQALEHFDSAYQHRKDFILSETEIWLAWDQYQTFKQLRQHVKQTEILNRIVDLTKGREGVFYQENLSEAYFNLAVDDFPSNPVRAQENFTKAIQLNFLERTSYLYIAYYYATTDQKVINDQFISERGSSRQPPLRENAFKFYYQNFLSSRDNPEFKKKWVDSEQYSLMSFAVKKYSEQLNQ